MMLPPAPIPEELATEEADTEDVPPVPDVAPVPFDPLEQANRTNPNVRQEAATAMQCFMNPRIRQNEKT